MSERAIVLNMKNHRHAAGYTIIEAIAVIFIMVTVMTALLANYSAGRDQQRLKKTTTEAITALHEVQNYALAGESFGVGQTKGYGVQFNTNGTYTLYAEKGNNNVYDSATDYAIATRTFADGILPQIYGTCLSSISMNTGDIVFVPPHPTLALTKDTTTACNAICVDFVHPNGQSFNKVSVIKNSGLIDSVSKPIAQLSTCP